uniref:Ycf36 n=1 Tax=Gracilaria firma TaxID=2510791 RepID=A0A2Z2JMN5_9FLOR|nr:Ycf36 [Gracilaria changii]ART65241.1 Ycf36 [Gracilaria changii]
MSISKKICPVPFDQQPLNEYFALKASCFFSWSTLSLDKYLIRLFIIFLFIFTVSFFLLIYTTLKTYGILKLIILNVSIATFIVLLIFIRLYLGWSYITKRLISATIFYEESGWYDGQLWIKSPEALIQDRLVAFYEVMPFLFRSKCGMIVSLIILFFEKILYSLLLI